MPSIFLMKEMGAVLEDLVAKYFQRAQNFEPLRQLVKRARKKRVQPDV